MKYFLSGNAPSANRILLVESGSRLVMEQAISGIARAFPGVELELCTCYAGLPQSQEQVTLGRVWRVTDAAGLAAKWKLARKIAATRPPVAALMFSGSPVMFNWKMALLLLLPSKILLINENGDFFWLDRPNLPTLRQFLGARLGMNGESMLRGVSRVVVFPFIFVFLLVFAAVSYLSRWTRLLYWKLTD